MNKYNETATVPVTKSDIARMAMEDFCRAQGVAWPGDEADPNA